MPVVYSVVGRIDDGEFHKCINFITKLAEAVGSVQVETDLLLEIDWRAYLLRKKRELGGRAFEHSANYIVIKNDQDYVGDMTDLMASLSEEELKKVDEDEAKEQNFSVLANKAYLKKIAERGHKLAYMDINIEGEGQYRLEIELYTDIVPKTANNFRCLCTGEMGENENGLRLGYRDSIFHRVVPGGWVQGGDITGASGAGGWSVYGQTFPDESFAVRFDQEGVVAMANDGGAPHSNGSQFFVALAPLPFLDRRAVALGRVAAGMGCVHRLAALPRANERPRPLCKVIGCGEIDLGGLGLAGAGAGAGGEGAEGEG